MPFNDSARARAARRERQEQRYEEAQTQAQQLEEEGQGQVDDNGDEEMLNVKREVFEEVRSFSNLALLDSSTSAEQRKRWNKVDVTSSLSDHNGVSIFSSWALHRNIFGDVNTTLATRQAQTSWKGMAKSPGMVGVLWQTRLRRWDGKRVMRARQSCFLQNTISRPLSPAGAPVRLISIPAHYGQPPRAFEISQLRCASSLLSQNIARMQLSCSLIACRLGASQLLITARGLIVSSEIVLTAANHPPSRLTIGHHEFTSDTPATSAGYVVASLTFCFYQALSEASFIRTWISLYFSIVFRELTRLIRLHSRRGSRSLSHAQSASAGTTVLMSVSASQ